LAEASKQGIADDVVARCLLSEAIRIFRSGRPIDDIAAELTAAIDQSRRGCAAFLHKTLIAPGASAYAIIHPL
jgi:hypothetical protein